MKKCPVCDEERIIIHLAGGKAMCIECYWEHLKEHYPEEYQEIVAARRA